MLIDVLTYYLQDNTSHLIIEHFLPTLTEQCACIERWDLAHKPSSSTGIYTKILNHHQE